MHSSLAPATLMAALAISCGSHSPGPPAGTPFTIWVYDDRLSLDGTETPLAGARVALDPLHGGDRISKTTAADGSVTFQADFSAGGADITVFADDHIVTTMLDASPDTARARPNTLGKPASDLVIVPQRKASAVTPSTVDLRGNIFGKASPDDVVALASSALAVGGADTALDATFDVRAPKGRPFFLLGYETKTLLDRNNLVVENDVLKSFRIDVAARVDDELLDIDLPTATELPLRRIQVHARPPVVPGSPFGPDARLLASVKSADSGIVVGVVEPPAAPTADGGRTFDVGVALVDTDLAGERLLASVTLASPDGSQSVRTEQGTLTDGATFTDFLMPPVVTVPDVALTIRDPIPFDGFPAGADLVARVFAGGELLWVLYGPPGGPREKTLTVPFRGEEVTTTGIKLFAVSLTACADRVALPTHGEICGHAATFHDVLFRGL